MDNDIPRKLAKREPLEDSAPMHHNSSFSSLHRSSKPSAGGSVQPGSVSHRLSGGGGYQQQQAPQQRDSADRQQQSSVSGLSSDFTPLPCRPFASTDAASSTPILNDASKLQQRNSVLAGATCNQLMTSSPGDDDELSCPPTVPGGASALQCQYVGASAYGTADQLYYAAAAHATPPCTGSASMMMTSTGSGGGAGFYNPYDPVVAAGLHRLQQSAGHGTCGSASYYGAGAGGGSSGYYAGLASMHGSRAAGSAAAYAAANQYGGMYSSSAAAHHQMSLMNLAAGSCISPPSPQSRTHFSTGPL